MLSPVREQCAENLATWKRLAEERKAEKEAEEKKEKDAEDEKNSES